MKKKIIIAVLIITISIGGIIAGSKMINTIKGNNGGGTIIIDNGYNVSPKSMIEQIAYQPENVGYWESVQRIVNQGPNVVNAKYEIGDVFYDSFDGSSVKATLVDISSDGTCTFWMDSVQKDMLSYGYEHQFTNIWISELPEDCPVIIETVTGDYYEIFVDTEIKNWRLVYQYENYIYSSENNIVNECYIAECNTTSERLLGHGQEAVEAAGYTYGVDMVLIDFDENYHYQTNNNNIVNISGEDTLIAEVIYPEKTYVDYVTGDLRTWAKDWRLPTAQELGIGDLAGNGATESLVWEIYHDGYTYENQKTVTNESGIVFYEANSYNTPTTIETAYSLSEDIPKEIWLEDIINGYQYYLDESGQLSARAVAGDFDGGSAVNNYCPCFKIAPQR